MNKTRPIKFSELRRLLEEIGYENRRTEDTEVFHISRDRLIYFRRYGDRNSWERVILPVREISSTPGANSTPPISMRFSNRRPSRPDSERSLFEG